MTGIMSSEDKRRIVAQNIEHLSPTDKEWEDNILCVRFPDGTLYKANGMTLNYASIIAEAVGGDVVVKKVIVRMKEEE